LYEIGSEGTIRNWYTCRILKRQNNLKGYFFVWLTRYEDDVKVSKWQYVHRLVAECHVANPLNRKEVNHKDGDKANCKADNLEWTTHRENIHHSYSVLGRRPPTGKDHWLYGKKASEETKSLMSQAKIGENHPKFKGWYVNQLGQRFASSYLLAKEEGLWPRTIYTWCKQGKNGYSFVEKVPAK
jgi:hypothetical protein